MWSVCLKLFFFFFQAEDGIRDGTVTGVQTCALPIFGRGGDAHSNISIQSGTSILTRGGDVKMRSTADAEIGGAQSVRLFGAQDDPIKVDTTIDGAASNGAVEITANGTATIGVSEFGASLGRIYLQGTQIKTDAGHVSLVAR